MSVLPLAALGPDFGPSHGAFTATDAATALLAFASAAVHTAALAADVKPTRGVATRADTAAMPTMRFEIFRNVVPFLASIGGCYLFSVAEDCMLLRDASAPVFKRRRAE